MLNWHSNTINSQFMAISAFGCQVGLGTEEMAASKFEGNCLYNSFSMSLVRKSLIVIEALFPFPFALFSTPVLY